ncbi:MAG: hypothetical protein E3J72_06515 [Planctomycetota bacterium]|nr:MAG: hypothetical protein E3J72_06515 [Planctomycetota bacterium]
MRKLSLLLFLLAVFSLAFVSIACGGGSSKKKSSTGTGTDPTGTGTGPTGTGTNPGGDVGALISAINSDRTGSGAGALTNNGNLAAVAQAYADYLASAKRTSYSSSADGKSPETRISNAGITFIKAGETGVISASASSASAAKSGMNSGTLNDPDFTDIGVGYAKFTTSG